MGEMKHGVLLPAIALLVVIVSCTSRPEEDAESGGERPAADSRAALWLVQAQQALDQGALNNALILTDSAMHEAPELTDLYFLRARIFTDMQRLDLAEEAYFQVLDRDRTYEGAWLNLGNAAFRKRAYDRALERYRKELTAYPSSKAWVAIGSTYEKQRQPDSARYAYEQAIALDSTYASAYLHLGQLHKSRGALDQAVAASRIGLRLDPDNVNYQYALGSLLILTGEADEAVQYLRAVVEARPWHYWANYNLGRAFVHLGRQEEAKRYFHQAERLQDQLQEIEYWQGLTQSNPDQFMLWVKLAHALRRSGRKAEAQEADRVALSLAPHYTMHAMADSTLASEHRRAG